MTKYLTLTITLLCILSSLPHIGCISYQESAILQDGDFVPQTEIVKNVPQPYKLRQNDVVSVKVKSRDEEYSDYFNLLPERSMINYSSTAMYVNGYSIDEDGYIDIPVVGKMKVLGKTLSDVKVLIQNKVDQNLNDATVFVSLVSFRISVLGEVNTPGTYFINNNQVNLLEGIAMAGGIMEFGSRTNLKLIRQVEQGNQITRIDLTNNNLIASPFFYLQPGDVIYIEPLEKKSRRSNLAASPIIQIAISATTAIFGGVSTILLINNQK